MKFNVLFSLLFIFCVALADASPEDSTKKEVVIPTVIRYIEGNAFLTPRLSYHSLDSVLDDLGQVNPAFRRHYNNLANHGSAASPQEFFVRDEILTDVGFHAYDLYLFNPGRIHYFKTNKAYSELNYHLAGGKEQQLVVALSQNILTNWNAGLDFNRLGSVGFLKNGTTFHSNFDLYTWFHSKDTRYNLLASAYWNTIENKVNGGLHSDSLYDNSSVSNLGLQGLLVNLPDAEHHFRNHRFSISQFYDAGFNTEEKTTDSTRVFHFKPVMRFEHSISLEAGSFTYLDYNPGTYYQNTYFSVSSLDSLHYYDLRNRISLSSLANRKNPADTLRSFYYSVGLEHQWMRYGQTVNSIFHFLDTILHNVSANGALGNDPEKKIHWEVRGNYVLAGANKNDYKGEIFLQSTFGEFGRLALEGKVLLKSPELMYQRYYSNHFIWENSFEKSQDKNISVLYSVPKFNASVGAEFTSIGKFIYADTAALPAQLPSETRIINYFLNKNFKVGKFHFNNSLIAQKVNGADVLHLPEFIYTPSLYYESFFYNRALLVQIGFDLHFTSAYYADAFMPATGLFYLQNEKKTNGYSLVDFYIKFKIKTARMFLKFENIGDEIISKGYYLTPHYPMQGMTLQFGVKWRFFDQ